MNPAGTAGNVRVNTKTPTAAAMPRKNETSSTALRRRFRARLFDPGGNPRTACGAADRPVETRQRADVLALQKLRVVFGRLGPVAKRDLLQAVLELLLHHHAGDAGHHDGDPDGHPRPDHERDPDDDERHYRTSVMPSNMSGGRWMPDVLSRSHAFGRTPVAR